MIPKIIHYCWFGGNPLPELAKKCIASWHKYLPDYEIKEWNENNFDIHLMPYVEEAYRLKKFAFVSDVARFWILYHYGGIYFDTDVEVIKPFDDIIERGAFMGCEGNDPLKQNIEINPGLGMGVEKNNKFYQEMLEFYSNQILECDSHCDPLLTIVPLTTKKLETHGYKSLLAEKIQNIEGINIYPIEYFCPINYYTGKIEITENTHSIHHYSASWMTNQLKFKIWLKQKIGYKNVEFIKRLFNKLRIK